MSKKQGSDATSETAGAKGAASSGKSTKREPAVQSSRNAQGGIMDRLEEFKQYLVLSRAEIRKVSWPTWKETRATTFVVLGFVAVMAILLGLVDLGLSSLIRFILS